VLPPCIGANPWVRMVETRRHTCRGGQGHLQRALSSNKVTRAPERKPPSSALSQPQQQRRADVGSKRMTSKPTGTAQGQRLRAPPTGKPSFDVIGGVRARPERSRRDDRRPTACRQRLLLQARMSSTAARGLEHTSPRATTPTGNAYGHRLRAPSRST